MYILYQNRNEEFADVVLGMTDLRTPIKGLRVTEANLSLVGSCKPLINRVLQLGPEGLMENAELTEQDRYFESWKALSKRLAAHPALIGKPGPVSFSTQAGALNYQWEWVSKANSDLRTPEYYFGDRQFIPTVLREEDCFFSDPESFYYWGLGEVPDPKWLSMPRAFVVKRPRGMPVVASVALGSIMVNRLDGASLSDATSQKIHAYARKMASHWNAEISECLFFVDGTEVTFGMHTASLMISSKLEAFRSFIENSVRQWRCDGAA